MSSLIDQAYRTVPFSPRARTVSSKRGGRLQVEKGERSKRRQRGRGRKRGRVRPVAGTSRVDLDLIDTTYIAVL